MPLITIHRELPPLLTPGSVVKAEDLPILNKATSLLAAAEQKSREMQESLERQLAEAREEGRRQGLEEARSEAARMHLKTSADVSKYLGSIQDRLLDALLGCVRSVILELPPRERLTQLLGKAIGDLGASQRITLSVNPASAALVNEALASLGSLIPSGGVEVKVRPDLPEESCLLETPMGIVDASLESQLQALKSSLSSSVTATPHPVGT
jgi:type III secretion protein L